MRRVLHPPVSCKIVRYRFIKKYMFPLTLFFARKIPEILLFSSYFRPRNHPLRLFLSTVFSFSFLRLFFRQPPATLNLAIAHFTTRTPDVLRLRRATAWLYSISGSIASGRPRSQVLQYTTQGEVAFGVNTEDELEIRV